MQSLACFSCLLSQIHLSRGWLNSALAGLKAYLVAVKLFVRLYEATRVWTHPCSGGFCGCGSMCVWGNLTLHYIKGCQAELQQQTSRSSSRTLLHCHFCDWSVAMTLLLTVLGAVLCSLTVSSELVPQADFNLQGVRHITGWNFIMFWFKSQYWFMAHVCILFCNSSSQLSQLQPENLRLCCFRMCDRVLHDDY